MEGDRREPDPLATILGELQEQGYGESFTIVDGRLVCHSCRHDHAVEDLVVEVVHRFEGPSDPADEAIVLAVRCARCGMAGTVVSAFGPHADPALVRLTMGREGAVPPRRGRGEAGERRDHPVV